MCVTVYLVCPLKADFWYVFINKKMTNEGGNSKVYLRLQLQIVLGASEFV